MSLICESCETESELCGSCHHGHIVCSDCLTAQVKVLLEDYRETKLACSVMGCSAEISSDWYDTLVEVRLMRQLAQLTQSQQLEQSTASPRPGQNGIIVATTDHSQAEQATLSVTTQCPRCRTRILVQVGCRFLVCRCGQYFCETCSAKLTKKDKASHYCGGHGNNSSLDSLICEICLKCNCFPKPVDRVTLKAGDSGSQYIPPLRPAPVPLVRTEVNGQVAYLLPQPRFHVSARTRGRRIAAVTTN